MESVALLRGRDLLARRPSSGLRRAEGTDFGRRIEYEQATSAGPPSQYFALLVRQDCPVGVLPALLGHERVARLEVWVPLPSYIGRAGRAFGRDGAHRRVRVLRVRVWPGRIRFGEELRRRGIRGMTQGIGEGDYMRRVKEALEGRSDELGLGLTAEDWDRLETLLGLWLRYGKVMNLSGARDERALLEHIEDGLCTVACARACVRLEADVSWVDVGSGGGFPALIVSACTPVQMLLVEPRLKRASFLELALAAIGRANLGVSREPYGDATWQEKRVDGEEKAGISGFAIATARAVWDPATWLEKGRSLVVEDGFVLVHVAHSANGPGVGLERAKIAGPLGKVCAYNART